MKSRHLRNTNNKYNFLCCIFLEWNAHENAVFDIAWMEGQEMLVRDNAITQGHKNSYLLVIIFV